MWASRVEDSSTIAALIGVGHLEAVDHPNDGKHSDGTVEAEHLGYGVSLKNNVP